MEGFPNVQPPALDSGIQPIQPINATTGGTANSGLLDALRGNPQLLKLLLMGLSGVNRQSPQPGVPTSGSTGDPLSTILNLYAMKQMMGNRPMPPGGMEGSPNMPASPASGSGTSNPLSWLSSLLGGGGSGQ